MRPVIRSIIFGQSLDPDARAYINAVELADGQPLESTVKVAINNFVVGCKNDGLWNAIKSCCILSAARTLNGALVPLKGAAPTNNGFISTDYDRKTGLIGDGSTKCLDTNRADNADPRNNAHVSVYVSAASTQGGGSFSCYLMGSDNSASYRGIARLNAFSGLNGIGYYNRNGGYVNVGTNKDSTGFIGSSRTVSTGFDYRGASTSGTITASSGLPSATTLTVFCQQYNTSTRSNFANCRLSFYSLGESLDLVLLENRINIFMATIGSIL